MADTYTTNLNLTKVGIGESDDTWGGKLNDNADALDACFKGDGTGTSVGLNVGAGKTLNVDGVVDIDASSGNIDNCVIGATTPAAGTFSTLKIVTQDAGYLGVPQETKSADYTLALADAGKHLSVTGGNITVPANATVSFPIGTVVVIFNNSLNSRNIVAAGSVVLRLAGTSTASSPRALGQYALASLVKVGADTWVVSGAGVS